MKSISLVLIAIIFTSSIVQGDPLTCATHPIFLKASDFLTRIVVGSSDGTSRIQEFKDAFSANTPTVLTADDLGICSQFVGEQTCCTKKMVEIFDAAAVYSVAKIQKQGTGVNKLVYILKKVIAGSGCVSRANSMTVEDILANTDHTSLQAYKNPSLTAKVEFSKVIARLNRGALCSLCAGVDQINLYFDSPDLQIDADSNDAFTDSLLDSFDGLDTAINNITLLDAAVDELLAAYIGDCSARINNIKTDIKDIFGNKHADEVDSSGNPKCTGMAIFTERLVCDTAQDGDSQATQYADTYSNTDRILEDTRDSNLAQAGGLQMFIASDLDDIINAAGDYTVTWPASMIQNDGSSSGGDNTNNNNNNNNSSTTSVSRIQFAAIALLFATLAL